MLNFVVDLRISRLLKESEKSISRWNTIGEVVSGKERRACQRDVSMRD